MTERRRLSALGLGVALGLVYDVPVAWGSRMWTRTPRVAAKVAAHGFLYARFDDHRLGCLVGSLRSAAEGS